MLFFLGIEKYSPIFELFFYVNLIFLRIVIWGVSNGEGHQMSAEADFKLRWGNHAWSESRDFSGIVAVFPSEIGRQANGRSYFIFLPVPRSHHPILLFLVPPHTPGRLGRVTAPLTVVLNSHKTERGLCVCLIPDHENFQHQLLKCFSIKK